MTTQSFTLALTGPSIVENDTVLDRLYEAGCSDASFGEREGRTYADFDRESADLGEAVASAIEQIESVPGMRVSRVEEQDLVAIADIAERTGRTRQNIWQMARGERGAGDFPAPAAKVGDRSFWRWSDIAEWFRARGVDVPGSTERAHLIGAINAMLEARNHMAHDATERRMLNQLAMTRAYLFHTETRAAEQVLVDTCTVAASTEIPVNRDDDPNARRKTGVSTYACAA